MDVFWVLGRQPQLLQRRRIEDPFLGVLVSTLNDGVDHLVVQVALRLKKRKTPQ